LNFHHENPNIEGNDFLKIIDQKFSLPVESQCSHEYRVTQCIAEYIRLKGYDGIIYRSSIYRGGRNIVIFEPSKVKPVDIINRRWVYEIKHLKYEFKELND